MDNLAFAADGVNQLLGHRGTHEDIVRLQEGHDAQRAQVGSELGVYIEYQDAARDHLLDGIN